MCQGAFELAVIDAAERQRRQGVEIEPADVERFQRRRWLDGAVAAAQEEQFVDVYRQGRRIGLELPVPARAVFSRISSTRSSSSKITPRTSIFGVA